MAISRDEESRKLKFARTTLMGVGLGLLIASAGILILLRFSVQGKGADDFFLGLALGVLPLGLVGGLTTLMSAMTLKDIEVEEDPVVTEARALVGSVPAPPDWYTSEQKLTYREGYEVARGNLRRSLKASGRDVDHVVGGD